MNSIISICGDNCSVCPRYIATANNDINTLQNIAKLWFRLGWRPEILPHNELRCSGCDRNKPCTHRLNQCHHLGNAKNCGECDIFPCEKIQEVFIKTEEAEIVCRAKCTVQEYQQLKNAFFFKRQILTQINNSYRRSSQSEG